MPSFRTIVRTTIDLAHQLGVTVVAEGVESEAVRSELQALGCDLGQGFLLGRPMAADCLRRLAARAGPARAATRLARAPAPRRQRLRQRMTAASGRGARTGGWPEQADVCRIGSADPPWRPLSAMLVVYGLWQVFRWGGHGHQALIGDLAFVPVNGAAAICAWRVSLRKDLGRPTCRAWRLLSAALWLYLLG